MATNPEVHIGDEGTLIEITVEENKIALNISTATVKVLKIQRKDKTVFQKDMDFVTDGSDGKLKYITSGSDIDMKGTWKGQVYLEMPGGKWHTSKFDMEVDDNLVVTS